MLTIIHSHTLTETNLAPRESFKIALTYINHCQLPIVQENTYTRCLHTLNAYSILIRQENAYTKCLHTLNAYSILIIQENTYTKCLHTLNVYSILIVQEHTYTKCLHTLNAYHGFGWQVFGPIRVCGLCIYMRHTHLSSSQIYPANYTVE